MTRRRFRDIYGNWVYEDTRDDAEESDDQSSERGDEVGRPYGNERERNDRGDGPSLDWRDWLALIIASLETVLLPMVIFIVVVIVLVAFFFRA